MKRLILLDKDLTLVKPTGGNKYVQTPTGQELLPGVKDAISRHERQGDICCVVTNQGGVAAGYKTLDSAIEEVQYAMDLLPYISMAWLCPDFEGQECYVVWRNAGRSSNPSGDDIWRVIKNYPTAPEFVGLYRKPDSGMLLAACDVHGFIPSPETCLMVGDMESDRLAAKNANVSFQWASEWAQ